MVAPTPTEIAETEPEQTDQPEPALEQPEPEPDPEPISLHTAVNDVLRCERQQNRSTGVQFNGYNCYKDSDSVYSDFWLWLHDQAERRCTKASWADWTVAEIGTGFVQLQIKEDDSACVSANSTTDNLNPQIENLKWLADRIREEFTSEEIQVEVVNQPLDRVLY